MCGIAGYIAKGEVDLRLDMALLVLAQEMDKRGGHSWGWTNWVDVDKGMYAAATSLRTQHFGHAMAAVHTRYATTGEKIADNSHPFTITREQTTPLIGMHNGIVYNHTELNRDYARKCAVDSMHIFEHIADGIDLNTIEAYGAIMYFQDGKLYGGRFNGGELAVALTEQGVIYASTRSAVERALELSGIVLTHFYEVEEGHLYHFTCESIYEAGNIPIKESFSKQRWNDATYYDWSKVDWEYELLAAEARDVKGTTIVEYCDFCGTERATLSHQEEGSQVCEDCALEEYGHVSDGQYSKTSHVRFTCEECGVRHGDQGSKHQQPKYRIDSTGQVLCAMCFWKNHRLPTSTLTPIGNSKLVTA